MSERIILAYSGGLDTSVAIGWIAEATGAEVVAVGCPACMMQLMDTVNRFGSRQEVVHYISLLAESYRLEKASN